MKIQHIFYIAINKIIYSTELQPMQFHKTWDTQFNKIVQGFNTCDNSLYQSQFNNQDKQKTRNLAARRQEYRVYNTDELIRCFDHYAPISQLILWEQLSSQNNVAIKKYRQSAYFGEFVEGARAGLGIMLYSNGRVYQGQWAANFKHGKGYQKFQNGAIYKGTYVKGKPQGYGTYSWQNGQTYQGQWLDGMKNGSGIWRGPNGDSYIGEWKNGQANGYGVHTWVNGDRYEGQFKDCLKHGEGIQKFSNGDSYKGTYVMGKPQGYGEYYWSMGSFFKGFFVSGLRDGKGVWKRGPGNTDKYQGEYKEDKKQGYGIFNWENGSMYKGNYVNDLRNGYGQMYWNDGRVYKGQWLNNQQVGGIQTFRQPSDSTLQAQRYHNEHCVHQNFHNQHIENRSHKSKAKFRWNQRKQSTNQQQKQGDFFQINPGYFQEPTRPEMLQTQKKFRARQVNSKRQQKSQSQKGSRSYMNGSGSTQQHNKFVRKYSVGSSCTNRKIKQGNSQSKVMSSTFYLYKIHGNGPALEQSYAKPKPRQVKTSGGMRQKHISQQLKHFTRSKINPEFS